MTVTCTPIHLHVFTRINQSRCMLMHALRCASHTTHASQIGLAWRLFHRLQARSPRRHANRMPPSQTGIERVVAAPVDRRDYTPATITRLHPAHDFIHYKTSAHYKTPAPSQEPLVVAPEAPVVLNAWQDPPRA